MKYFAALVVVSLALTAVLFGFVAVLRDSDSAVANVAIKGVDTAQLQARGITLTEPRGTPRVTPEQARRKGTEATAAVREIVLASLGRGRDVWVINYDPATLGDLPSSGPYIPGVTPAPHTAIFALDFIDAQTGEFVSGIREDAVDE